MTTESSRSRPRYELTPTGNPLTEEQIEAWREFLKNAMTDLPVGANVLCDMAKAALRITESGTATSGEKPCETCNDDPQVCATVPGLRHCEVAMRDARIAEAHRAAEKQGLTPTLTSVPVSASDFRLYTESQQYGLYAEAVRYWTSVREALPVSVPEKWRGHYASFYNSYWYVKRSHAEQEIAAVALSETEERSSLLDRAERAEKRMLWFLQHVSADEVTRVLKKPVQTIGEAIDEIERMANG